MLIGQYRYIYIYWGWYREKYNISMLATLLLLAKLLLFGHICAIMNFILWYAFSRDLYKSIRKQHWRKCKKQNPTSDSMLFPSIVDFCDDDKAFLTILETPTTPTINNKKQNSCLSSSSLTTNATIL